MLGKERGIKAAGRTVAVQDERTWDMIWKIPREDNVTAARVQGARAVEE